MTILDIDTAAEALGITSEALRMRIQRGDLDAEEVNGQWLVRLNDMGECFGKDGREDTGWSRYGKDPREELIREMREQVAFLRDQVQRKDHIIMALTQKIQSLPAQNSGEETPDSSTVQEVIPTDPAWRVPRGRKALGRHILTELAMSQEPEESPTSAQGIPEKIGGVQITLPQVEDELEEEPDEDRPEQPEHVETETAVPAPPARDPSSREAGGYRTPLDTGSLQGLKEIAHQPHHRRAGIVLDKEGYHRYLDRYKKEQCHRAKVWLWLLVGPLGGHKFYLGNAIWGVAYLAMLTILGGSWIHALVTLTPLGGYQVQMGDLTLPGVPLVAAACIGIAWLCDLVTLNRQIEATNNRIAERILTEERNSEVG